MLNEILTKKASSILTPLGFKKMKKSRTWFFDKEFYLIVVNFESSSHDKGTYVDVGLCFPWGEKEYISYDFFFGPSNRVINKLIPYENDAQFEKELDDSSKDIIEAVHKYLSIKDVKDLSELINVSDEKISAGLWIVFHKAVIEGLLGNKERAVELFNDLIRGDDFSDTSWLKERAVTSREYLNVLEISQDRFGALVKKHVVKTRELLEI